MEYSGTVGLSTFWYKLLTFCHIIIRYIALFLFRSHLGAKPKKSTRYDPRVDVYIHLVFGINIP